MRIYKRALTYIVSVSALLGFPCSVAAEIADTAWPMFQHDMYHAGQTLYPGPNIAEPQVYFDTDIGGSVSSPVIDSDGTIYAGSVDGCMYAISFDGSRRTCLYETGAAVKSTPVLSDDGVLYFGSNDGSLYAVTTDGTLLWDTPLGTEITSAPAIAPAGDILVGVRSAEDSGTLFSLDGDGKVLWKYETGPIGYSYPAVDAVGNVYIGTKDGEVVSLTRRGSLHWTFDAGESIASPVINSDGVIYVSISSGLIALDNSGKEKWRFTPMATLFGFEEASGLISAPAMDQDGLIYIGGVLGDVHCLSGDGAEKWSLMMKTPTLLDPMPAPILSSPALGTARAYILSGVTLYSFSVGSAMPADVEHVVLSSSYDPAGEQENLIEASPAIGTNRNVVVAAPDGMLYGVGSASDRAVSISGEIKGIPESYPGTAFKSLRVNVLGETGDEWQVPVRADGSFKIAGLQSGAYLLTPLGPGLTFDPPSQRVTMRRRNLTEVEFTAAFDWLVKKTSVTPKQVSNDAAADIVISVWIAPAEKLGNLTITADLSAVGGLRQANLRPGGIGAAQDGDSAEGLFEISATVPAGTPIGSKMIPISITGDTGRIVEKIVTLTVGSTVTGFGDEEFEIELDYEVPLLEIQYNLTGFDNETAGFLLNVFKPGNAGTTPDYTATISGEGTLQIADPDLGTWRYRVTKIAALSSRLIRKSSGGPAMSGGGASYSVSTTTAGTGVVFGSLTDAETGLPVVANVDVRTTTGGSSPSSNGYFFLVSPAGAFTLTTLDRTGTYATATKTVSLMSGGTAEADLLLQKGVGASSGCALEYLLGSADLLRPFRAFRDTRLSKTDAGRRLIERYYRFSAEVITAAREDAALRTQLVWCALHIMPAISAAVQGGAVRMTAEQRSVIAESLQLLRQAGGDALRDAAGDMLQRLQVGSLLEGIEVQQEK